MVGIVKSSAYIYTLSTMRTRSHAEALVSVVERLSYEPHVLSLNA